MFIVVFVMDELVASGPGLEGVAVARGAGLACLQGR